MSNIDILAVALGILASLYFGNVLGIYIYCKENELRRALHYIWYIPIHIVIFPVFIYICNKSDFKIKSVIDYIFMPEKYAFFAITFNEWG
jgi:hypothetical protein